MTLTWIKKLCCGWQGCVAGAWSRSRSLSNFGWLKPKPEPGICFWFHSRSSWGKRAVKLIECFSVFNGINQFGTGVAAQNVWYLVVEPEPTLETWVPSPQPWLIVDCTAGGNIVLQNCLIAKRLIIFLANFFWNNRRFKVFCGWCSSTVEYKHLKRLYSKHHKNRKRPPFGDAAAWLIRSDQIKCVYTIFRGIATHNNFSLAIFIDHWVIMRGENADKRALLWRACSSCKSSSG